MAQFPLIDQASLAMIPGAYKESKVYSQLPTDGSGDFTFSRGTDNATRVNEERLIEKGYENLLLQSNSFDTVWTNSNTTETGGQADKDGGTDAWLLSKSAANGMIYQSITSSGIQTLSVYAKKGTNSWMQIYAVGSSNVRAYYNLGDGTLGAYALNIIDRNIENIGSGWYRCSVTFNSSITNVRIFVSDGSNDDTGTSGNIYIQDAQLNQGLVAYPYLETTAAPAYGGITANQPRLNYTGDCPSLFVEESRTNSVTQSEYLTGQKSVITYNNQISPEGLENALKQTGDGSVPYFYIDTRPTLPSSGTYNVSIFVKKGTTDWFRIRVRDLDTFYYANFNITSKVIGQHNSTTTPQIVDYPNDWKRISMTFETTTDLSAQFNIAPMDGDEDEVFPDTSLEYAYFYGLQCEKGSYPSSYIPTYGSAQTRAAETLTATKTLPSEGTLYINVGGTTQPKLSVLGEFFNASATENKVAIAYSATALKISHNGSIVVDKTGTYDVSSLTEIDLGHDGGTDQSDTSIGEFITFGSFLTTTELNALTQ